MSYLREENKMQIDMNYEDFVDYLKELDIKKSELLYVLHMKNNLSKELIKDIEEVFGLYENLIAGHRPDSV
jgi:predicted transcriptional regulator